MDPPPISPTTAPLTTADQDLHYITVLLAARGWTVTDARQIADTLHLIAHKPAPLEPLTITGAQDAR